MSLVVSESNNTLMWCISTLRNPKSTKFGPGVIVMLVHISRISPTLKNAHTNPLRFSPSRLTSPLWTTPNELPGYDLSIQSGRITTKIFNRNREHSFLFQLPLLVFYLKTKCKGVKDENLSKSCVCIYCMVKSPEIKFMICTFK